MGLELELKAGLGAAEAASLSGELDARAGRHQPAENLRAIYFDSEDERLGRAGIALRIRAEGKGLVQTAKIGRSTVGGFHQVREVEAVVPRWQLDLQAVPDAALRADILEKLGGQEATPRFQTRIQRQRWVVRHDHGIVEAALDEGEIRAGAAVMPVHELELELLEGSPESVFELAADLLGSEIVQLTLPSKAARGQMLANGKTWQPAVSGGKPSPAVSGEPGVESWGRALEKLAPAIAGNLFLLFREPDPEGPHQLRVALRRLRSAIHLHKPLLRPGLALALSTSARDIGRLVAPLRDCDVLTEAFARRDALSPDLLESLAGHRQQLREEVIRSLRDARATGFAIRLLGLASIGGWKGQAEAQPLTIDQLSEIAFAKLWKKALRLGDSLSALADEERHELRKYLKKIRYLMEISPSSVDRKNFASRIKKLQEELGFLNDVAVFGDWNPPVPPEQASELASARKLYVKAMTERSDLALGRACRHWRDVRGSAPNLAAQPQP